MTGRRRFLSVSLRRAVPAAFIAATLAGCAPIGRLSYIPQTVAPMTTDSTARHPREPGTRMVPLGPMFGDTLIGLVPGTADSSRRYLGRLRDGYTADTLNIFLLGDNRPGNRVSRLQPEYSTIIKMFSGSPVDFLRALVTIPFALVKGLYPDLALLQDIPPRLRHMPTWGPERKVVTAVVAKLDSLQAHGEKVSALINTGDLVNDGRRPAHWQRFLSIHQPLTSRVPYFPVAGNHERTDTQDGVANWRTATGLPASGDRLYYCFDSADGWVRFIALDSNPMADPAHLWSREAQIKYSEEEIGWMVARLKEHNGPAFVFLHHPPFSLGFHRVEWEADSVLRDRRERMMQALHEAGIGVLAAGHEHAYERALFTWPDAVLINIVTGGAGGPLHSIPPPAQSAKMFSDYKVAGAIVDSANVVAGSFNHFILVRLWFGGGELYTYAVDKRSRTTLADQVRIDFTRYGVPKIDEHKIPILPKAPSTAGGNERIEKTIGAARADSTATSKRLLTTPSPREASRQQVKRSTTVRDSVAAAKRDSLAARKRAPARTVPGKSPTR
jgi:hypothetical protein